MSIENEKWLEEASYKLALLTEFEDHFIVPDGKTLKAFLMRPTLILKMMNKEYPDLYQEDLEKYENFEKNKKNIILHADDLKELQESYEKGLSPNEAVINIIKWCDTPEDAGQFLVSPEPQMLQLIMYISFFLILVIGAVNFYINLREHSDIKRESKNISTIYIKANDPNNTVELNNEKAIKAGIIPTKMIVENGKVSNIWEGNVMIESTKNSFKLTYLNVPTMDACFNLIKKQSATGWSSVSVGDQEFKDYNKIENLSLEKACDDNTVNNVRIVFNKNKNI